MGAAAAPPPRRALRSSSLAASGKRVAVICDAPARQGGGRGQVARPAALARSSMYLGAAILGDGRIALLVDPAVLVRASRGRSAARRAAPAAAGADRAEGARRRGLADDPRAPAQHPRGGRLSRADGARRPRRAHAHRPRRRHRPRRHRRRDARDGRHRADRDDPRPRHVLGPARRDRHVAAATTTTAGAGSRPAPTPTWSSASSTSTTCSRRSNGSSGDDARRRRAEVRRVLICEDSQTYAAGLSRLLARDPEIDVVGVCSSAEETLARLQRPSQAAPRHDGPRAARDVGRGRDRADHERPARADPRPRRRRAQRVGEGARRRSAPARSRCSPRTRSTCAIPAAPTPRAFRKRVKLLSRVRVLHHPRAAWASSSGTAGAPAAAAARSVIGICASAGGPRRSPPCSPRSRPASRSRSSSCSTSPRASPPASRDWLDDQVPLPRAARRRRARPRPGIWVAPEGAHLALARAGRLVLDDARDAGPHRPSADVLLRSVAAGAGARRRRGRAHRHGPRRRRGARRGQARRRAHDRAGRGQLRGLRHAQGGGRARGRAVLGPSRIGERLRTLRHVAAGVVTRALGAGRRRSCTGRPASGSREPSAPVPRRRRSTGSAPASDPEAFLRGVGRPAPRRAELLARLIEEVTVKETSFLRDRGQLASIDWPLLLASAHAPRGRARARLDRGVRDRRGGLQPRAAGLRGVRAGARRPCSILATDISAGCPRPRARGQLPRALGARARARDARALPARGRRAPGRRRAAARARHVRPAQPRSATRSRRSGRRRSTSSSAATSSSTSTPRPSAACSRPSSRRAPRPGRSSSGRRMRCARARAGSRTPAAPAAGPERRPPARRCAARSDGSRRPRPRRRDPTTRPPYFRRGLEELERDDPAAAVALAAPGALRRAGLRARGVQARRRARGARRPRRPRGAPTSRRCGRSSRTSATSRSSARSTSPTSPRRRGRA